MNQRALYKRRLLALQRDFHHKTRMLLEGSGNLINVFLFKSTKFLLKLFICLIALYFSPYHHDRPCDAQAYSIREQPLDLKTKLKSAFIDHNQLISIAIPDAINVAEQPEFLPIGREIIEVISNDIEFSGTAKVIDRSLYPSTQKKSALQTDFSLWKKHPLSVDFLIRLYLSFTSHQFKLTMEVVNIHSEKTVMNKTYQGHKEKIRSTCHLMANDLIKLITNANGIAHSKIAFISPAIGPRDIFQMDYDGKNVRRLTYEQAIILFPALSPTTKKLAYVTLSQKGPLLQIRSIVDGLAIGSFSFPRGSISSPSFSPDGNLIAFASSKDGNSMQLYTTDLQTNQIKQITDKSSVIHTSPRWNPQNNREIAFISDESGTPQIHIINVDEKKQSRLLQSGGSADSPAWSPNGEYIAFCWKPERAPRFDIFVMDITTREIVQLTSNSGNNESPSWSPDGRYLAFQSDRTGRFEIYTMRIDGTRQTQLTTQGAISPIWFE